MAESGLGVVHDLAYMAATVFFVGVCFMWPTMLGIASERFPQGGAFTMGLLGFVGQFALGLVIFKMGALRDSLKAAAGGNAATADAMTFRYVATLAIFPFIVFAAWWIKDYLSGGYKAVKLSQSS